ncbi:MAG: hypothetical protein WBI55_04565, partial [Eubacteriales bacterium]
DFPPTIYHAVVNTKICAELLNGLCSDVTEFDCVLAELIVIARSSPNLCVNSLGQKKLSEYVLL